MQTESGVKTTLSTAAERSNLEFRSDGCSSVGVCNANSVQLVNESVQRATTQMTTNTSTRSGTSWTAAGSDQDQVISSKSPTPDSHRRCDAEGHQDGSQGDALGVGRGSAFKVDADGTRPATSGTTLPGPGRQRGARYDDTYGDDEQRAAEGSSKEGNIGGILREHAQAGLDRQRDHVGSGGQGAHEHHEDEPGGAGRFCGLRMPLQGEVHHDPAGVSGVCEVGEDDPYQESGETGVDHRLARLARWLEQQPEVKNKPPPKTQGYMTANKDNKIRGNPGRRSDSRASRSADVAPTNTTKEQDKKLELMAEALDMLRAELAEVRAERLRKTVARSGEEMTDSSFSMLSEVSNKKSPEK